LPKGCIDPIPKISHLPDIHKQIDFKKHKKIRPSIQVLKESTNFKRHLVDNLEGKEFFHSNGLRLKSSESKRTPQSNKMNVNIKPIKKFAMLDIQEGNEKDGIELKDITKLDQKKVAHKIEVESKNVEETAINQSKYHKKIFQKLVEDMFNTNKQPSKSLDILQQHKSHKTIIQEPKTIIQEPKTIIQEQSLKFAPNLQKQVSFFQPSSIEAELNHQPNFQNPPASSHIYNQV
jgi:predicted DNA-binding protein (UPF0251 family)